MAQLMGTSFITQNVFTVAMLLVACGIGGCGESKATSCEPVQGELATFEPVTEGCFLYSGGLERTERGHVRSIAAVCNTCNSSASHWLKVTGTENDRRLFYKVERGEGTMIDYPILVAEGDAGDAVFHCLQVMTDIERNTFSRPVEFPPFGELRSHGGLGDKQRDDCSFQDCTVDGEVLHFGAKRLLQIWPPAQEEAQFTRSGVCDQAQSGVPVGSSLQSLPHVRVELSLEEELRQVVDEAFSL